MKFTTKTGFSTFSCLALYTIGLLIIIWQATKVPFSVQWLGVILLISSFALLIDGEISKLKKKIADLERSFSQSK